ncbi:MAG TPA: hypothetical protein VGR85_05845 [Candidatus Limnocylindria bacterium]|nr:hypothetical protein [Candidatus Limnocylindria bacterium]
MRRPPEPPPFDDDALDDDDAVELLGDDLEDDDGDFDDEAIDLDVIDAPEPLDDVGILDDEPEIPDEPPDFAGTYEFGGATPVDQFVSAPPPRNAEDARHYIATVSALEGTDDDDDSDDAARFLTYRNYVGALAMIVRDEHGASPYASIAADVRTLPGVRRIQRRRLSDLGRKRAARELRGAWAYELSMSPPSELFAIDVPDLVMIANHTAGVLAHYAIYKMCRALALALALGMIMPEDHEGHLDLVEEQFLRRGLLPTPWDARCDKGRAPRSRAAVPHLFTGMPNGTAPCPNLWAPTRENMWPLVATALKTTRDRSRAFESELDRWRHAHRSKAAKAGKTKGRKRWVPYDVQDALYAAIRPTNVLDFVYRLRRRSSYLDDSSFLSNSIGMRDAIGFNRDLLLFTRSTLHVLETLIERAAADDFLARTQEAFAKRTNPTLLNWTFASRPR